MPGVTNGKGALAGVLAVVIAGVVAAPAGATVFCVAPAAGCVGVVEPTLQQGLDAALAAAGPDTVQLPEGTVTGPGSYLSADPANTVALVGAGRDRTVITSPTSTASDYSLDLRNSATLSDLTVKQFIPAVPFQDTLLLEGTADRVGISTSTGSFGEAFFSGTARHITANGPATTRVNGTLEDAAINGGQLNTGAGNTVIRRARVVSPFEVGGQNSSVVISSSLVVSTDPNGHVVGFTASPVPNSQATVVLSNDTFIGGGGLGCVGIEVSGDNGANPDPADFAVNSATIASTIVRNCRTTLSRQSGGGHRTADITVVNSDIDLSPIAVNQTGAGTLTAGPGDGNLSVDPLFVGLNGFDQELRFSSPLVDHGLTNPVSPQESATDLNGNPRVVDGNGDGVATRDIGALEYQRRHPVATASVSAPTTPVGQAVTFTGSAKESDPGETVTGLAWRFDDGGAATGTDAPHAFAAAGKHTATLTATDSAGVTATATASVFVLAPGVPAVTSLTLSPATFRAAATGASTAAKKKQQRPPVGTKVKLVVGGPAAVTLRVQHLLPGRRSGKRCAAPARSNRRGKACSRVVAMPGAVTRALGAPKTFRFTGRLNGARLGPGRYRLLAQTGSTPVKAAGFRIVR
jgi:PKD domain